MAKIVLLIEDDLDLQRIYSSKIENSGYEVLLSIDASHGLSIARNRKPNLILLDIMIPGKMNGFELLKYLKGTKEFRDIPVIVLTNLDTEKEEAIKMGAIDYIIKANANLNEIIEKIGRYSK